ncbi:unnamed protein product [Anisakis simplex]|uniref:EF-hand domain-containing protein n=1 Tax=Anisakis simplex TaxID=6269 RepID=A0A0M3K7Y6_ANISI|nr:unnamed protein product [Anisakis simplex]
MGSTRNDSTEEFGDNLSLLGDNDQQDNIESKRREVRAVFDVFDEQRCGSLDVIDVAHVVRCLGFNPTQHDLDASFSQIAKGGSSRITFEHLFARVLAASENDEWHRGQIGELERAISIIAPQQPITKDYLIMQLTSRGLFAN